LRVISLFSDCCFFGFPFLMSNCRTCSQNSDIYHFSLYSLSFLSQIFTFFTSLILRTGSTYVKGFYGIISSSVRIFSTIQPSLIFNLNFEEKKYKTKLEKCDTCILNMFDFNINHSYIFHSLYILLRVLPLTFSSGFWVILFYFFFYF
jgi:hypothetical protein